MVDDYAGFPSEVLSEAVNDLYDVFAHEALWETGSDPFFSANDRPVIATAL